jgi:hypothetical protein
MSGIEAEVLEAFLGKLKGADLVGEFVVEGLRTALSSEKLPRADVLTELFVEGSGDALA